MKNLAKHYPFTTTTGLLDYLQVPAQPFDPAGDWANSYGIYLTGGAAKCAGTLRIKRRNAADKSVLLTADFEIEQGDKILQRSHVEIRCANDQLATPEEWRYEGGTFRATGEPVLHTAIKGAARLSGKKLRFEATGANREVVVEEPLTLNRCLFDAVQRLPRKAFDPVEFAVVDDLDQIRPRQRLNYREAFQTSAGVLHAYNQLGWGILPTTWWVNEQGRLLIATGGVMAYVLDANQS